MKRTDVPIESLFDMAEDQSIETQAGINRNGEALIDLDYRSTKLRKDIQPAGYPDVAYILEQMVGIWQKDLDPKMFVAKEFNYLRYGPGDLFGKHKDLIPVKDKDGKVRVFSSSTIIKQSDDLEGGDFIIYDHYDTPHTVPLKPGETIFFSSNVHHEVTKVTKGNREVLVAWIYERSDKDIKLKNEIQKLREHERQFRHPKDLGMV